MIAMPDEAKLTRCEEEVARAYAGWTHLQHFRNGWSDDLDAALARAESRVERAIELDPHDPYGHWTLGAVRLRLRRHDEALFAYRRAIDLGPNNAEMLAHFDWALTYAGRPDDGAAHIEAAIAPNPRHPGWSLWDLGFAHFVAGRYDEAVQVLEPRGPGTIGTHHLLALSYAMMGVGDLAAAARDTVLAAAPETTVRRAREVGPFRRSEDRDNYVEAMRKAGFPEGQFWKAVAPRWRQSVSEGSDLGPDFPPVVGRALGLTSARYAAFSTRMNETDWGDARGIAEPIRPGWLKRDCATVEEGPGDAGASLRGRDRDHASPLAHVRDEEMGRRVGRAHRQEAREGRARAQAGRDDARDLGRRHRVRVRPGCRSGERICVMRAPSEEDRHRQGQPVPVGSPAGASLPGTPKG
jgi:hypothetical protein